MPTVEEMQAYMIFFFLRVGVRVANLILIKSTKQGEKQFCIKFKLLLRFSFL